MVPNTMLRTAAAIAFCAVMIASAGSFAAASSDKETAAASEAGDAAPFAHVAGEGRNEVHSYRLHAEAAGVVDYDLWMEHFVHDGAPDQGFAVLVPETAIDGYVSLWDPPDRPEEWIYLHTAGNDPFTKVGARFGNSSVYYNPEQGEGYHRPLIFPSFPNKSINVTTGEYRLVISSSTSFRYEASFTNMALVDALSEVEAPVQHYSLQEGDFEGAAAQASIKAVPVGSLTTGATLEFSTSAPGFLYVEAVRGTVNEPEVTLVGPDDARLQLDKKWNFSSGVRIGSTMIGAQGGVWQADLLTSHAGTWTASTTAAVGHSFDVVVMWTPFE